MKPFVPDYPLYVIDLGHDDKLSFPNQYLEELKMALSAIYSETADTNETEIDGSVMALAGILAGDSHLYTAAKGERRQKMCKVLEKRDERIYSEFKDQLEEKDAELEKNRIELEDKDAEIAALKAQILAMQK